MNSHGVSTALLVQTPWYGEDNRYLVDVLQRYPGRFAAVGYLPDPLADNAPDILAKQYHADGFRGVRIHLTDARNVEGLAQRRADPLLQEARRLGIPVEFLNRDPKRHDIIYQVAKRFSDVRFVIDHLGHPRPGEGVPYTSSRLFFACGKLPNVFVKVSLYYKLSSSAYPWTDLHPYQQMTVDAFGPQRLMWGSNFPMDMPQPSYTERLDAVRLHFPFLTPADREWILGATARQLWAPSTSK